MKRLTAIVLAAMLMLGSISTAYADGIDIKVKGQWDFAFGWVTNGKFKDSAHHNTSDRDDDPLFARQRIRTQINFISSEYLQGVLMFEIGTLDWGRKGAALDADGINVETKRAYLDWVIPNTDISLRMGIQGLKLPSTPMGSPLFDADVAGIVASSPICDWISISGFWIRPFDAYSNDGSGRHYDDETDIFGLLLPMEGDGWSVTPWGMYGFVGASSGIYDYLFNDYNPTNTVTANNSHTNAWWAGAHFELTMFDPFVFNLEGIYGSLRRADLTGLGGFVSASAPEIGTEGWFIGATLDYKLDWGVPGLFGWYSSGDDDDAAETGKLGRLPVLGNDGGSFYPTSFGFAGSFNSGVGADTIVSGSGSGTWGVGIQLADVSFIENLSHTLRVAYYAGTNDADLVKKTGTSFLKYSTDNLYLTTNDNVIEVNFDHTYQIYENFTTVLELGWLRLNVDHDTWGGRDRYDETDNAWKAQILFQYKF